MYARELSQFPLFEETKSIIGVRRKGNLSYQSIIVCAFLKRFAEMNEMSCPRGRGSRNKIRLLVLPTAIKQRILYLSYKESGSEK